MAGHPLKPATHRSLGGPLPHQQANETRTHPRAAAFMKRPPFPHTMKYEAYPVLAAVSHCYPGPKGRSSTRYSPVRRSTQPPKGPFSLDLHVLGTPLAFNLSQDQTLQLSIRVTALKSRLFRELKSLTFPKKGRFLVLPNSLFNCQRAFPAI